jgi:hypothetical protein
LTSLCEAKIILIMNQQPLNQDPNLVTPDQQNINQEPTNTQPQANPQTPDEPAPKSRLLILAIIAGGVLLIIGGFIIYQQLFNKLTPVSLFKDQSNSSLSDSMAREARSDSTTAQSELLITSPTPISSPIEEPSPLLSPTPSPLSSPSPSPHFDHLYQNSDFGYQIGYNNDWRLRETYGPNIEKQAPTDILSGIDLHLYQGDYFYANVGVNLLSAHGLTDIDEWIEKYDLNYPKQSTMEKVSFNQVEANKYLFQDEQNKQYLALYFLKGNYAYKVQWWGEINSTLDETNMLVNSFFISQAQ